MSLNRVFLNIQKKSLIISTRNYSAVCINCPNVNIIGHRKQKYGQSNVFNPHINSKRNISFDGILKWQEQTYISISNSSAVNFVQEQLLHFHDISGLNWSATIIICTILVRVLLTLPIAIQQNQVIAKLENIHLELNENVNEIKKETAMARKASKLTDRQTFLFFKRSMGKKRKSLIERDNCHPFKATLGVWFQIPIWVSMSFALRNFVNTYPPSATATITMLELSVGGFGWIPNLTLPDETYILPILFGMSNLALIEIQRMCKIRETSMLSTIFTNIFRVFTVVLIPVAASMPSCICLYWTTSSIFGLVQNLCLLSPSLRRKLRIPEAPSELKHPYNTIKDAMYVTLKNVISTKPIVKKILPKKQ